MLTIRRARGRSRVWWVFGAVFVGVLALCIVAVHRYPFDAVRPGSDYDVAMKNLFLQGFAYCASPGAAALLAGLAIWLTAGKPVDRSGPPT
jgi:hypothetical protein